ncbi:MAG: hypothetical protein WCA64_06145 [Gallionella sp.]
MNKLFAVLLLPFSAALVTIVLLGCATKPNKFRQNPPEFKFVSLKSSKLIAECIIDKWQHVPFAGPLISRRTPTGYTIIQNSNGGVGADPAFISDIIDIPAGTETSFYTYYPLGNSASYFQDSVKECQ